MTPLRAIIEIKVTDPQQVLATIIALATEVRELRATVAAALAEVERLRKDLAHSEQRAGMHPSCPHCGRVTGNEELPDGRECCVADIDRARAIRCGCPKEEP